MKIYLAFFILGIVTYLLFYVDLDSIPKTGKWSYKEKITELSKDRDLSESYLLSLISGAKYIESTNAILDYLQSFRTNLTHEQLENLFHKVQEKEENIIFDNFKKSIVKKYRKTARG